MSEMDELKRNAEISRLTKQVETMNLYIRETVAELDHAWKKERSSWNVYGIAWLVWVVGTIFNDIETWGPVIDQVSFFIFLGGWLYTFYWGRELSHAGGKYRGTMKTLFILGYIDWDIDDNKHKKRLKRGVWAEGFDIVKGWAEKVKSARKGFAHA